MRERFFESEQMNTKKAVRRDLEDAGINHPDQWREAFDLDTPLDRTEIKEGKINNEEWQKQLNTAFEQGNYSLIQTLRKVRPDRIPDPEIIKNKLNELVVSRPNKWVEEIQKIKYISNIQADPEILSEEFKNLLEQFNESKIILGQLKTFIEATGYNLKPEIVQKNYRSILVGNKNDIFITLHVLKGLILLTGFKPDSSIFVEALIQNNTSDIDRIKKAALESEVEITNEMIQQVYEGWFEKDGYLSSFQIRGIGQKPNAELVQRAYQKIIEEQNNNCLNLIQDLKKATEVQPIFTEEQMRPLLEKYINHNLYSDIRKIEELTGIKPTLDLIRSKALKIIDEESVYINRGEKIKKEIENLTNGLGIEFKIPESEIQNRYQKAITDKKPSIIMDLYDAFEIKPSMDKETVRRFMLSLIYETSYNYYQELLEKIFGIKFKATDEEIEAKQDEALEKLDFYKLEKIKELTGKDVDRKKLEITLYRWLEKEATSSSQNKVGHSHNWDKEINKYLRQFNITIPPEVAINIYTVLIENEPRHSDNLIKTLQLTGIPIPVSLAQKAYQKYLTSDDAPGSFSELFKISGIKPEIPKEVLQSYYRNSLEQGYWDDRGIHTIENIAKITGTKPEFDHDNIEKLYKQLILSNRVDFITSIRLATDIELQLDEETKDYVYQQIEAGIEKACSGDYEEEKYGEKKFDTYSLEQDLKKVGILMEATGVMPNTEKLQLRYSQILASDPYWDTKIKEIYNTIHIQPVFSPEELQAKGQQLLEKGSLHSFENLQPYGKFTFTPEIVTKTYDTLLIMSRYYEEYDKKYHYNKDWLSRIRNFETKTGIAPSETQLAKIFSYILEDHQILSRGINSAKNRVEAKIKFFISYFSVEITSGMMKDIAIYYITQGDFNGMREFVKETGVTIKLTDEDILPHVNHLLKVMDIDSLMSLRNEMGLVLIPVDETVVQSTYQHLVSKEDFGRKNSESLQSFKKVFELTNVAPNFPAEQIDQIYKASSFVEWRNLKNIMGLLPTSKVIQRKYLQFFLGNQVNLENNIGAVEELTGEAVAETVIKEMVEKYILEGKTRDITKIIQISGIKGIRPEINSNTAQLGYRKVAEKYGKEISSEKEMIELFNLINDNLGIPPDKESLAEIFINTLGKHTIYDQGGKKVYLEFWQYLVKKFGKLDSEVVQRIYLNQLSA